MIRKCLSVLQPYADLIVNGKKTIELRRWNTNYRGEFLVHAPQGILKDVCNYLGMDSTSLTRGAIVGRAEIYDVKKYHSFSDVKDDYHRHFATTSFLTRSTSNKKEQEEKKDKSRILIYGFLLKKSRPLSIPIPMKGKLGFFDIDNKVLSNAGIDKTSHIESELFEEEHRYQWIGHH